MKKFIIQSNEWFEKFSDMTRFLSLIGIYTFIVFFINPYFRLSLPIFVLILVSWRMSYAYFLKK